MDTHIKNDPNNPTNYNGNDNSCKECQALLEYNANTEDLICFDCKEELDEEEYMRSEIYKNSLDNR